MNIVIIKKKECIQSVVTAKKRKESNNHPRYDLGHQDYSKTAMPYCTPDMTKIVEDTI